MYNPEFEKQQVMMGIMGIALTTELCRLKLELIKMKRSKRRTRRFWTRNLFLRRNELGAYNLLYKESIEEDPEIFNSMTRMDYDTFMEIVEGVRANASKQQTLIRDTIEIETRVSLTLRYLALGDSFTSLSTTFRVSKSSISNIIASVCDAIINGELCKKYMIMPQTTEQWMKISQDFDQQWNFPNCLGAIDGKHFSLQKPKSSGSHFYNYKGFCSIVLLAVCDANYKFTYIDVGTNGRASDGGTWGKSGLCAAIESNRLNIPSPTIIGNNRSIPYCLIGDEAFPLKTYLMRPFPGRVLNSDSRKVFNYRLSRARRTIENTFGIMASQWRLFRRPIDLKLETCKKVIYAACILHNMLRYRNPPPINISKENTNNGTKESNQVLRNFGSNNSTNEAKEVRETLCEYFMSEGKLNWQHKFI